MVIPDTNPEEKVDNQNNQFIYIWIDILGFREELKTEDEDIYERLFKIRDKFNNKFSESKINAEETFSISDSLVIVCNLSVNLNRLIEVLAKLQIEFILGQEKLIRGAIAIGRIAQKLYYENKDRKRDVFLISNGVLEAYKLESQYVNWPIIATTDEVLKKIRQLQKIPNDDELFNLKRIFGKNNGFMYFIDFLQYLPDEKRNHFEIFLKENIRKFENEKTIFEKYYWLLRYYEKKFGFQNDFLESFTNGVLL